MANFLSYNPIYINFNKNMKLGGSKQQLKREFAYYPLLYREFYFHNRRNTFNFTNNVSPSNSYINRTERDEPISPIDRVFLQPELDLIVHCVIGVKNPIDVDAVKTGISTSISLLHPRFSSLVVKDWRGQEHWRPTEVNADQHVIVRHERLTKDNNDDLIISDEDAVNDYLAELSVSWTLSRDKPLWELHLLMAHKCVVLRVHHAIGDGTSLMSLFLSLCRRADDPNKPLTINGAGRAAPAVNTSANQWTRWSLWNAASFSPDIFLKSLSLNDKRTILSGGAGVELWPKKLVTAKFKLDDMKLVKKAIPNATINDVLLGIISYGLYKYLQQRSPKAMQGETQFTGVGTVNMRSQPGLQDFSKLKDNNSKYSEWGNKFSMILLPINYPKGGTSNSLHFVKRANEMMAKKKLSLDALFTYEIGGLLLSNFIELGSLLTYRMLCNSTFMISNIMGPQEDITISGNPVDYIRVTSTSFPQAMIMYMVSYAGRTDMQILVAKDIIPDPKCLANCFEDALLEMKKNCNYN